MMDKFLSHRESPRPAFARDLAARLSAARPVQGARRGRVGLRLGAAGLSLLVALGWGALGHQARDSSVAGMPTSAQPVALLLPGSGHPALVATSIRWTPVDTLLVAPPTPLSHHH